MKLPFWSFNHYFLGALLATLAGCATTPEHANQKEQGLLQLFLEADFDAGDKTAEISICRSAPELVRIYKTPFLDNAYLTDAKLVDAIGGFAIQVKFNPHGILVLDQISTEHRSSRFAIYCAFQKGQGQPSQGRWLAAPMIGRRISDGTIIFTPDATREEAEHIVRGLNNTAVRLDNKPKPGTAKPKAE